MQTTTSDIDMSSTNPREFIRLLMENERRLYAYIRSILGNSSDAEDVLQETSIILWDKFSEFDSVDGNFIAWSFKVAYYTSQNYRRKKRRSRIIFSDCVFDAIASNTPPQIPELDARHEKLAECLEQLPTKDRELLTLRYDHETSIETTAKKSGRTVQAVYKALSRVRAVLFDCVNRGLAMENPS